MAAGETDVEGVRQPPRGVAVQDDPIAQPRLQSAPQTVSQIAQAFPAGVGLGEVAGCPEAGGEEGALGAGPPAVLVAAAVHEGGQRHPAPDEQGADALGGVQLVSGQAEQIDAELAHPHRNLAGRLGRVGVEEHAVPARDA